MDDGPDDGSKRQKQAQEDEDADADSSIHLDSLMDVLKPKKTDALADFADKDEDQPIAEPVFPSLPLPPLPPFWPGLPGAPFRPARLMTGMALRLSA